MVVDIHTYITYIMYMYVHTLSSKFFSKIVILWHHPQNPSYHKIIVVELNLVPAAFLYFSCSVKTLDECWLIVVTSTPPSITPSISSSLLTWYTWWCCINWYNFHLSAHNASSYTGSPLCWCTARIWWHGSLMEAKKPHGQLSLLMVIVHCWCHNCTYLHLVQF